MSCNFYGRAVSPMVEELLESIEEGGRARNICGCLECLCTVCTGSQIRAPGTANLFPLIPLLVIPFASLLACCLQLSRSIKPKVTACLRSSYTHRSRAHPHYHLLTQDTHTLRAPASLAILRLYRSSSDSSGPSESSLHVLNHPAQSIDGSC